MIYKQLYLIYIMENKKEIISDLIWTGLLIVFLTGCFNLLYIYWCNYFATFINQHILKMKFSFSILGVFYFFLMLANYKIAKLVGNSVLSLYRNIFNKVYKPIILIHILLLYFLLALFMKFYWDIYKNKLEIEFIDFLIPSLGIGLVGGVRILWK